MIPNCLFHTFDVLRRAQSRYRRTISRLFFKRPFTLRNRTPIISFTFDDFPRSALLTAGEILAEFGCRGTYYASLGLMGKTAPTGEIFREEDLKKLLSQGHELGCHTFAHCHSWDTAPGTFKRSILQNREALHTLFPEASFKSFSYPIMCPRPRTKRELGRLFDCCRGSGGQTLNQGKLDLSHLWAYFLEKSRDDANRVRKLIEQNAACRGWLVFATHDVCAHPTTFGCTPQFFREIVASSARSGARILPVAEAWNLLRTNAI